MSIKVPALPRGMGTAVHGLDQDGRPWVKLKRNVGGKRVTLDQRCYSAAEWVDFAEQIATDLAHDAAAGGLTVALVVARFIDQLVERPDKRTDLHDSRTLLGHLKNYIKPAELGRMAAGDVKASDVEQWWRWLRDQPNKRGGPMGKKTASNIYTTLSSAMAWGRAEGLYRAPDRLFTREFRTDLGKLQFHAPAKKKADRRALTVEELTRILVVDALMTLKQRTIFRLAIYTGLRQGELFGLRWSDVDLEHWRHVTARRTWLKAGLKNHADERTVPLLDPARRLLQEWWIACGRPSASTTYRRVARTNASHLAVLTGAGPVFSSNRYGRTLHGQGYDGGWSQGSGLRDGTHQPGVRELLGLPEEVTFHSFRHTCATALVNGWFGARVDLDDARAWLGHDSIETTRRYKHDDAAQAADAAKRIDEAVRHRMNRPA